MTPKNYILLQFLAVLLLSTSTSMAEVNSSRDTLNTTESVVRLLETEPMSVQNWPIWRDRLLTWPESMGNSIEIIYETAEEFMVSQANEQGQLTGILADDAMAWSLLGVGQLGRIQAPEDAVRQATLAETALKKSLELDYATPDIYVQLAVALLIQAEEEDPKRRQEAETYISEARYMTPDLPIEWADARAAFLKGEYIKASRLYEKMMARYPDNPKIAVSYIHALLVDETANGVTTPKIEPLIEKFPDNGTLSCFYALSLARDGEFLAAEEALNRAEVLRVDPDLVLGEFIVSEIRSLAAPSIFDHLVIGILFMIIFYAVLMAAMAGGGWLLALFTSGNRTLWNADSDWVEISPSGQVIRTGRESLLARLYVFVLMIGLVFFYVAVPFVIIGILAGTAGVLYTILLTGFIPIKIFLFILLIGLMMAWAVIRSLFIRADVSRDGIVKTAADEPKLHQVLNEVAGRVGTAPVDEVYVSPGSEIGVHETGRGPFGIFGVKRRVLLLGLASLQHLSVQELKSILAHEYAHFSHGDTFFNKFVYRVTLSIELSLHGMAMAGGYFNYINPFYWFMYLYCRAYAMTSAGFSRSREYLADRMAAMLYGSNVFKQALTNVATRGAYFENSMFGNVAYLVEKKQTVANVYNMFRTYEEEHPEDASKDRIYQEVLTSRTTLFASHPGIPERLEAIAMIPEVLQFDHTPARTLLMNPDASEEELTDFITTNMKREQEEIEETESW